MSLPPLHSWKLSQEEAVFLQSQLCESLVLSWDGRPVHAIGGADVGFAGDLAYAGIVVLSYPDLSQLSATTATAPVKLTYIPGLLAFREGPVILEAWENLSVKPDLLMFDGQGIAHPRGFGLASHIGLWLGIPTIGVAKSRLYGRFSEVGPNLCDQSDPQDEGDFSRTIGAVVRTREKSKPIFISAGHLIDLETAIAFVLACCRGHRLPEPIRQAHKISNSDLPMRGKMR